MEFASASRRWAAEHGRVGPEELIRSLLEAVVRHLPADGLGHAKGCVEYRDGAVFASSTLTPSEIHLRESGPYRGGPMEASLTLIFAALNRATLDAALDHAEREVAPRLGLTRIGFPGSEDER